MYGMLLSRRRFGEHHLAFSPVETDATGWRDAERARIRMAKHRRGLVTLGNVDQVARQQPMPMKRCFVAREAALVLHPALDIVKDDLRQLTLRHPVQVFDVYRLIEFHSRIAWD